MRTGWASVIVGLFLGPVFGFFAAWAADPQIEAGKIRKCSAWCVESYKGAVSESLSCIDSCQRGSGNHPVALCAKRCVGKHAGNVRGIVECIQRCGAAKP